MTEELKAHLYSQFLLNKGRIMAKGEKQNKKSNPSDEQSKSAHTLFVGSKKALYGVLLAGAIALGGQWLVGQVYNGYEAR